MRATNTAGRWSESAEQCALISWWALAHKTFGVPEVCLFAVPNGGRRDAITGARLKEEGVRAGIPDLFLAYPKNGAHGLFLEMKRQKGSGSYYRATEAQKKAMEAFTEAGYLCVVAYGAREAIDAIEKYLGEESWGKF